MTNKPTILEKTNQTIQTHKKPATLWQLKQ